MRGPASSARRVREADDIPAPELNDNEPVLRIEHDDGSISISMDGKSLVDQPGKGKGGWFDNLVEDIDQGALGSIAICNLAISSPVSSNGILFFLALMRAAETRHIARLFFLRSL